MLELSYLLVGLFSGFLAGLFGIAGGIVLVPILVFFFGYSQKLAQGTTIAVLLPPIGFGAAWLYYRAGNVNVKAAIIMAVGMFIGGFFGAEELKHLSSTTLSRAFGVILLLVAGRLILGK